MRKLLILSIIFATCILFLLNYDSVNGESNTGATYIHVNLLTGEKERIHVIPSINGEMVKPGLTPEESTDTTNFKIDEIEKNIYKPDESFNPGQIIFPDDRTQVMNTAINPWRTVVEIEFEIPNAISFCSGAMLWVSSVSTAAHCIYSEAGLHRNIKIRPGRNGQVIDGECFGLDAYYPEEWEQIADSEDNSIPSRRYDWAILHLGCKIGNRTGALGFRGTSQNALVGLPIDATGYPTQDPNGQILMRTMWTGEGEIVNSVDTGIIRHTVDTSGGQSGGPIWQTTNIPTGCSNPCILASGSGGPVDGISANVGPYIDEHRFFMLSTYGEFTVKQVYLPGVNLLR